MQEKEIDKKKRFKLSGKFNPAGDQGSAIESLLAGLKKGERIQTLHGATGTGKTFTMANLIEKVNKPTLVIAHNKTLAAQLASEFSEFFPDAAVHYFVSYYDYYQPEAYIKATDTFIEKEVQINKEIDMLRHASTASLITRSDVIIVASVSCIYGLGSPEEYKNFFKAIKVGDDFIRNDFLKSLVKIFYERTNSDLEPGKFRLIGSTLEIIPANIEHIYRVETFGAKITSITILDSVSRQRLEDTDQFFLFPAKHFVTAEDIVEKAVSEMGEDLKKEVAGFDKKGMLIEAQRLERRVRYDMAMIKEVGYCNGIENYSRYFSGKEIGQAPDTLFSYFPKDKNGDPDFMLFIDESHMTIPQIGGMYNGDRARKINLVDNGFRLEAAKDNRPLKFEEFEARFKNLICVSATPGKYELEKSTNIAEQIIRPTGLLDPLIEVRAIVESKDKKYKGQVMDFIEESQKIIKGGHRVLATTLTKKMAEDLSEFLKEKDIRSIYIHSEVDTLERIEIISDFRAGKYDILVGVNLLREGLDMPEVSLIGILDADKEGFLRSETALVQTIGRAARNENGKVILYADKITGSMERAIKETNRRREVQEKYNKENNITPTTIVKNIKNIRQGILEKREKVIKQVIKTEEKIFLKNPKKFLKNKKKKMELAVKELDFETAAILRDEIRYFEKK